MPAKKDNTNFWLIAVLLGVVLLQLRGGGVIGEPSPFVGSGLRVLIVEETAERGTLPLGQLNQLTATGKGSVLAYCREHCVKTDADPGYKMLDKDSDPTLLGEPWVGAWSKWKEKSGGKVPWLLVGDGASGVNDALPMTAEETLAILGRYAK